MIDEEATRVRFGYTSDRLSKGSHKKIVRLCDNCGRERELEFRTYFKTPHINIKKVI